MDKEQLLSNMPDYYENSDLMANILNAYAKQFAKLKEKYDKANNQLSYHTADTDLYRFEEDFGIITDSNRTLEERRAKILAKLRGQGTVTIAALKALAESYVNQAEIIEHNSDYSFDVILKTKTSLERYIEDLISQIESSKPCHLDYTLIIDYFTILVIHINFARYNSEKLTPCGTIDVSGNPRIATDGRKYGDTFIEKIKEYFSNALLFASPETYPNGSLGKSFNENISDFKKFYFSKTLEVASDNTVMHFTNGLRKNEIIADTIYKYNSTKFEVTSDSKFIYMTNGLSINENITDKYSANLSEPFRVAIGTEGLRANEQIIDKCSRYLSTNILHCSNDIYCGGGVYS